MQRSRRQARLVLTTEVMPEDTTTLRSERDAISEGTVMAGKYCLERLLGSGAQGWVWAARNLDLDIPVAIKLLRNEGDDTRQPAQRLFREARSAARLGHPAIVRVFDLGEDADGTPFIVMERLQGETLADRLARDGCLSPELAVRTMLPIADALLATHSEGIIHRDVKPANIFLAVTGPTLQPKLMDFGIARFTRGTAVSNSVTQSGAIVGTPSYVSPEQARGLSDVDHRSDMWSFCTTLYECMTLSLPFNGTSWPELCHAILADEPRSLPLAGVDDDDLWRILGRGLSKAPEDRWENMLALGKELATWLLRRDISDDICGTSVEARWLRGDATVLGVCGGSTSPSPDSAKQHQPTLELEPSHSQQRYRDSTLDAAELNLAPSRRSGSTLSSIARPLPGTKRPARSTRWLAFAATALPALGLGGIWYAGASHAEVAPAGDGQTSATSLAHLSPPTLAGLGALPSILPPSPSPAPAPAVPNPLLPTTQPQSPLLAPPAPVAEVEASRAARAGHRAAAFSSYQRASATSARSSDVQRPGVRTQRAAMPELIDPYAPASDPPRSSHDESRLPSTSVFGSHDDDRAGVD